MCSGQLFGLVQLFCLDRNGRYLGRHTQNKSVPLRLTKSLNKPKLHKIWVRLDHLGSVGKTPKGGGFTPGFLQCSEALFPSIDNLRKYFL